MSEKPMLGGCCVCLDERGWAENPLVYCDGQSCTVAVHQACYGIVKVPSGPWFCRKCESQERAAKVKCELCPHRDGALKKTDNSGWAHVVCALYIPEVTFGSVSTMEPIILAKVPNDRYNKVCSMCEEENRSSKANMGACMDCAKQGCKVSFHVTCCQISGLLCEESTGMNQTKYIGYCKAHLPKGKKTSGESVSRSSLYKSQTSSSEEAGTTEDEEMQTSESFTKPGDIRYTKAGKKRTKSLEESLLSASKENTDPAADAFKTEANIVSDPVHIPSEKDKSASNDKPEDSTNRDVRMDGGGEENDQVNGKSNTEFLSVKSSLKNGSTADNKIKIQNSQSDVVTTGDQSSSAKDKGRSISKRVKKEAGNSKSKETKKPHFKKDNRKKGKVDKNGVPLSGFIPHRPVPPQLTNDDQTSNSGAALQPRHSITTLSRLGLDSSEICDPHDTAENNRIFKDDLVVDGVTAVQQLMEEQLEDCMKFFHDFGTSSEVATLMDALRKIREENGNLEYAIREMTRRKEQLMLLKTKLSLLQVHPSVNSDAGIAKPTPNAVSSPMQVMAQHPDVKTVPVTNPLEHNTPRLIPPSTSNATV